MRTMVVAAVLAAFLAACDNGGGGDCYKGKDDVFGQDAFDLYSWIPGGSDLLRQAERTVVRDAVGELENFSAPSLQNARVPNGGQDIVYTAMSSRYMDAGDLALFASRFGPDSGVTMFAGTEPKEPGEYVFVSVEHVDDTPLLRQAQLTYATDRRFQYGAVFQKDNLTINDWVGISPFDADTFMGSDSWYQVSKAPGEAPQLTHQLVDGTNVTETPTGACALAYGNAIIWMIPKKEFPGINLLPGFRTTAFESDANFGQNSGDFSIDTAPLRGDQLAWIRAILAGRNTRQIEIETKFIATNLDFTTELGVDLNFLGDLEADSMTPGETAVPNDTAVDRLVRTMSSGGTKGMYNYVPSGSAPGAFFPLSFLLSNPLGNFGAFARTPGDVLNPFVASKRAPQPNDVGIDFKVPIQFATDPTRGQVLGSYFDAIQRNVLLQALETNPDVTVLSAPRITTLNGQTAAIQSFNYITPVDNLDSSVGSLFQQRDPTVQDAETGIQLQVTPRLAPDGRVLMELRPGFAAAIRSSQNVQADNETFGVMFPSIVTKDIKTNVTIESGQTVVIGGLMEQGQMTIQQGVPWLKDLPIINYLFTTRKNYDEQTKLMIMITPYIVDSEDR